MEILRVFNNNVVLAKGGDGGEVILTGRGLGFQAKPGQTVDESKVVRTFVPSDGRDPDHLAQMLADIPPEIIRVVVESMQEAGLGERETGSTTLVMALSDHVANAVERVRRGIDITYPLLGEVRCSHRSMRGSTSRCRTARPPRLPCIWSTPASPPATCPIRIR